MTTIYVRVIRRTCISWNTREKWTPLLLLKNTVYDPRSNSLLL